MPFGDVQFLPASVTSVSNSDGTLVVSPSTGDVVVSLNLSHANVWKALQTFGNNISIGGGQFAIGALAVNDIIQWNGVNWVNVQPTAIGLVDSVSNSDGSLTISPTTGAVVASLNVGHGNIWTAAQTYSLATGSNALLFGATGSAADHAIIRYINPVGPLETTLGVRTLQDGALANEPLSEWSIVPNGTPPVGQINAALTLMNWDATASSNGAFLSIQSEYLQFLTFNEALSGTGTTIPMRFLMNGTETFRITIDPFLQLAADMTASTDNARNIGTATNRFASVTSNLFSVYHASGDSNPTSQLGDAFVKFGAGGPGALDLVLKRSAAQTLQLSQSATANSFVEFDLLPAGTPSSGVYSAYIALWSQSAQTTWFFIANKIGSGLQLGYNGGTALQITTVPNVELTSSVTLGADNTYSISDSTNRLASVSSLLYNIYHASADANPTAQLGDGFVKFGGGGASPLSISMSYSSFGAIPGVLIQELSNNLALMIAPSGANHHVESDIFRTSDTVTNYEVLQQGSDITLANLFQSIITKGGTGSYRDWAFYNGGSEAFRITTDPYLQIASNATGAGLVSFGTGNSPSAHLTAPYTWVKMKAADGTICCFPVWQV